MLRAKIKDPKSKIVMPSDIDFPRLSSAELVGSFGSDQAALLRYRMLAALLREGRSPGEVARTFGVSRRSCRAGQPAGRRDQAGAS